MVGCKAGGGGADARVRTTAGGVCGLRSVGLIFCCFKPFSGVLALDPPWGGGAASVGGGLLTPGGGGAERFDRGVGMGDGVLDMPVPTPPLGEEAGDAEAALTGEGAGDTEGVLVVDAEPREALESELRRTRGDGGGGAALPSGETSSPESELRRTRGDGGGGATLPSGETSSPTPKGHSDACTYTMGKSVGRCDRAAGWSVCHPFVHVDK